MSLFFTFITVFFSVIQRAEMSNSWLKWVLLFYSLIKICIHGYTTVRTANIRVTTFFFIVASYPKQTTLCEREIPYIYIRIMLTTLELINQTLHFKLLGRLLQGRFSNLVRQSGWRSSIKFIAYFHINLQTYKHIQNVCTVVYILLELCCDVQSSSWQNVWSAGIGQSFH